MRRIDPAERRVTECHLLQRAIKYYVLIFEANGIYFLQSKMLFGAARRILAACEHVPGNLGGTTDVPSGYAKGGSNLTFSDLE
jgi:hypothetical protein